MTNILPVVDWAAEALRPTLLGILRRLDKTFNKIYKKPSIRVSITMWLISIEYKTIILKKNSL